MRKTIDDFVGIRGKWVQGVTQGNKHVWTTSGSIWNNIKLRCSNKQYYLQHFPTYAGCVNGFSDFNSFTNWHRVQIGYNMGYCLDADILRKDVKIYCEETCLLIPNGLNIFIQGHSGKRATGNLPQGIYLTNNKQALRVQIYTKEYGYRFIGTFALNDIKGAKKAYSDAKNEAAWMWYQDLLSGEFPVDSRVIEYMKNWRHSE